MRKKTSRRNVIKSLAGLGIGMELAHTSFAQAITSEKTGVFAEEIDIKVLPPGPKSQALIGRMKNTISKTNYAGLYGVAASGGNGSYIIDLDSNVYIDCLTSASTNILGYGNNEVSKAYFETANKIQNTAFLYTPNFEAVKLAEKLAEITPGDFNKKVMFGLSGSDSSGAAIETARKYTGKMGIISFNFAYHGTTGLSQQASGFKELKKGIYNDSADFVKVDFPTTLKQRDKTLKDIESILAWGTVGAVMVEAIQGDAGTLLPHEGFFLRLMEVLHEYNVLLIDDEVQSGMGRTGKWWAIEHENVTPDLIVAGKGLSGGYAPISAVIGRADIIDSLEAAQQVFSYAGHGPSCAAALKVIQLMEERDIRGNTEMVGAYLLSGLKGVVAKYPGVFVEARGRGFMIGLEINLEKDLLASKIFAFRCLEKGIYFGYIGDKQRVIRVLPPLTLNQYECNEIIRVVNETAEEMHNNSIPRQTVEKVQKYARGW